MQIKNIIGLVVIVATIFACKTGEKANQVKGWELEATVNAEACDIDTLRLYAWTGVEVQEIYKAAPTAMEEGGGYQFVFKADTPMPQGLYYVGVSLSNWKHVMVGNERRLKLKGVSCDKVSDWAFEGSEENAAYESIVAELQSNANSFFTLLQEYQVVKNDPEKVKDVEARMLVIDNKKKGLLDSLQKGGNKVLEHIVALNTYLSYQNNKADANQAEGIYLAESYFQYVDFNDSLYARLPYYFEAVKAYSSNITQVGLPIDDQRKYLNELITKVDKSHPNHKPTLLGVAFGVMRNPTLFREYGRQYLEAYPNEHPAINNFIDQQITKMRGNIIEGDFAPNISAATPEGEVLALNDLRGKVVLIDFWASWCGPCRKENPNVVKMYEKYKDKGFEILGVSLDKNRDRWLKAIEDDNLTWPHISDLQGWASQPAQTYKVSSIPYTVLVDKEGKIIAKKLRGPSLEAKLEEIFGE